MLFSKKQYILPKDNRGCGPSKNKKIQTMINYRETTEFSVCSK